MDKQIFTPPQERVVACGLLTSGYSAVLQMPTGSGKTWLAEMAIEGCLRARRKGIYLSPTRALAEELLLRWKVRFESHRVGIFTGDYGRSKSYPVTFAAADVLIMTPERLDACTRAWRSHWDWIPEVDLLVVDEFHLLGDLQRGPRLEGAISRLRRLNPFLRILALSATLGNLGELADWLGGAEFLSTWRPVPINWRICRFRKADEKPAIAAAEVARNVTAGGKSLIFVQSRRRAEELSNYLRGHGLRSQHHHAGLDHKHRTEVENQFRQHQLDVLVATATLEMGLNLPVRQVVLHDLQAFSGHGFSPLSVTSVWQRVGRAGRLGLDAQGEAVLIAPIWDKGVEEYHLGRFEPIQSGLSDPARVAEQVLVEVASGLARSSTQVCSALSASLGAHQGRLQRVDDVVSDMRAAGMLIEVPAVEDTVRKLHLKATRLGRVTVRHMLSPQTVLTFRSAMERWPDPSFLDLLLISSCSLDCEPVMPVDFEELDALAEHLSHEPSLLLRGSRSELEECFNIAGRRLLAAMKMAIVVRTWTRLADPAVVADTHDCYPFEVARLCESIGRLLLGLAAVADYGIERDVVLMAETPTVAERITALQRMVELGLDEQTVTLTFVTGIGAKTAAKLNRIGITDIEELAQAEPKDVTRAGGISLSRATQWVASAESMVSRIGAIALREANLRDEDVRAGSWPHGVDPYRLRRAIDLQISLTEPGIYRVTGGLEPHIVLVNRKDILCDCADFAHGHTCKHILAVRIKQRDAEVTEAMSLLASRGCSPGIDLFDLWVDSATLGKKWRITQ